MESGLTTPGEDKLHAGERAAMQLAELMRAGNLLDEKAARRIAMERGLQITGALGILGEATTRGRVDPTTVISRLRATNFRYSPAFLKAALDRFKAG